MGIIQRNIAGDYALTTAQRRAAQAEPATAPVPAWETSLLWVPLTDDGRHYRETLRPNGYVWVYAYTHLDDLEHDHFEDTERTQITGRELSNNLRDRPDVGIGIIEGRGPDRRVTEVVLPELSVELMTLADPPDLPDAPPRRQRR